MMTDEATITTLNFLLRTYDAITKTMTATKNRIKHVSPETAEQNDDVLSNLKSLKGKIERRIVKSMAYWPIWTEYLINVRGLGPFSAGNLIMLYYYRHLPICKETGCGADLVKSTDKDNPGFVCSACGKKAKSEGILKHRLEFKKFNNVSGWWKYMGMHVVDGKKPKRKKGVASDWSARGRQVCWTVGQQFVQQGGEYRKYYDTRKALREKTHPKATQLHRDNMARNETAKLFLSHFIQVAKFIEGEEFTKPYAHTLMGHTGFLNPFYFEPLNKPEFV